MIEQTRYNLLITAVFLFPQLIILISCIFYLSRKISVEGVFLLLGTLGTFSVIVFNQLIIPQMLQNHHSEFESQSLFYITGGLSFLSALVFAIGFMLLVLKKVKKQP
jgi:glucan phosphoethanolaminetransferase (alkaline phosphatase superfamily)